MNKRSTLNPRLVLCAGELVRQRRLTWRRFARAVGAPTSTCHYFWQRLQAAGDVPTAEDWREFYRVVGDPSKEKQKEVVRTDRFRWESSGDEATLEAPTSRVRTLEELLELAKVDLNEWQVDRHIINSWEQAGFDADRRPVVTPLFQVKAWLSRKKPPIDFPAPVVLKVNRPRLPRRRATKGYVSVHYSDIHFPHHDPRALSILYQVLDLVDPDLVVDHGDTADCEQISKYAKDPFARVSLADELRMVAEHHARVHSLTPRADHVWLLGNHEDRIRRRLWQIAEDRAGGELVTLPGVRAAFDLARLTGVDQLGWEVIDYPRHLVLFDRLIVTHGEVVRRGGGASARAEYERYGKSGISGHTHRRGVYEHRDYNGVHAWWEIGALCKIRDDYVSFPDWQQGFAVVTWSHDHTEFAVETVRIHEGVAWFRGQRLVGEEDL